MHSDATQWGIAIGLREAVMACGCCTVGHHYRFEGFKISSY